ncbi:uncharacterized protein [Apostichopus japonicus]|uniref:uncharacterized protein n=1 Tax=Stichopus japonicus TaxID=307972 RepID=UPI003AB1C76B
MALLVEDEDDRHNCCGDWKWESLTEDIVSNHCYFTNQFFFLAAYHGPENLPTVNLSFIYVLFMYKIKYRYIFAIYTLNVPFIQQPYINEEGQFSREGEDPRGISGAAQRAVTELHLLFLTKEVLTNLVKQTNLYATQERDKEGDSKERWSPVTREEVMAFIGVAIAMGIVHKGALREYW